MARSKLIAVLTRDGGLLLLTRFTRLFAYGALSVILVIYLTRLGLGGSQTGLLLTLTLAGDTAISLWLATHADRIGRRRTLIIGALLMAGAGLVFALTRNFLLLLIAAAIGVISPSGNEVGPFLSIEQAGLAHLIADRMRTRVFAWYTLTGALATATGSLCAGLIAQLAQRITGTSVGSDRIVVIIYAALGLVLAFLFSGVSPAVEVNKSIDHASTSARLLGLAHSRGIVLKLASLFALDSFGGGFVVQSFLAYWFYVRFRV